MIDRRVPAVAAPLFLAAALGPAVPAHGGFAPLMLDVQASSESGSGSYQVTLEQATYDAGAGTYFWAGFGIALGGSGVSSEGVVATIDSLIIVYDVDDPQVSLAFALANGSEDAEITIASGLLEFATIDSGVAAASAGMTLTDVNCSGAWLEGLGPEGGAFLAQRNGLTPDGDTIMEAIESLSAAPGTTADANASVPGGGGFAALAGPTGSLSSRFHFMVSAHDLVSGTSTVLVQVVPLPPALGLGAAGLAGAALLRRRHTGQAAAARQVR